MESDAQFLLYGSNILELNIPVLIGSTVQTSNPLKCIRCGDSIPSGQVNTIAIALDLDPSTRKGYIGWPVCDNCHDNLVKRAISIKVSTPEHPGVYFQWLEFLRVTLGVCLSEDHSTYDGVDSDKLPSCPICDSPVNPELGHLVLGVSYKGLPGRNFGVGEAAWTMMHWDCATELLKADAKMSFDHLDLFAKAIDREYKSSKESSDTTPKTDTDGVPK